MAHFAKSEIERNGHDLKCICVLIFLARRDTIHFENWKTVGFFFAQLLKWTTCAIVHRDHLCNFRSSLFAQLGEQTVTSILEMVPLCNCTKEHFCDCKVVRADKYVPHPSFLIEKLRHIALPANTCVCWFKNLCISGFIWCNVRTPYFFDQLRSNVQKSTV